MCINNISLQSTFVHRHVYIPIGKHVAYLLTCSWKKLTVESPLSLSLLAPFTRLFPLINLQILLSDVNKVQMLLRVEAQR